MKEKAKIRQPLGSGVAKVPVIMQMEALECGAACLAMILAYYGKWVPLEQVRLDCGVSRDGSKMKNIYLAGVHYGLEAHGYKMEIEGLKKAAAFPCIIHWEFNHFVVLDGFRGDKAVINDPARGKVTVSMEQFDRSFTGLCLTFAPGEGFTPSGKRKSTLSYAFSRLRVAGPAAAFVILTAVIASLFGIINPTMSRLFYDRLLTRRAPEWLIPFIIARAALRETPVQDGKSYRKLSGELSITGLTFGYSRLAEPVISDFSMHIKPGQRIAIVGASGWRSPECWHRIRLS